MRIKSLLAALLITTAPLHAADGNTNYQSQEQEFMITEGREVDEVRQAIDELIQTATTYDVDVLDRIYHDGLHVVMIDTDHNVNIADKAAFKGIFAQKRDAGDPPMNTWAKYHRIELQGDNAHVLLSRKNDLSGKNMDLILSIDLIREDDRWQVSREVIFLRPEEAS